MISPLFLEQLHQSEFQDIERMYECDRNSRDIFQLSMDLNVQYRMSSQAPQRRIMYVEMYRLEGLTISLVDKTDLCKARSDSHFIFTGPFSYSTQLKCHFREHRFGTLFSVTVR